MHSQNLLLVIFYCWVQAITVYAKDDSSTVTGLLGEAAELPCNVDVASCGEVYFITWTKNTTSEWKRLYLYSDDVEKPLQELANPDRADFVVEKSTAHLRISPLRMEDEGNYKCDVTYVQGKCPSLSYANLVVIAKPSPPVISKDGNTLKNTSTVGPFLEGETLTLECSSAGGKPPPVVTWWNGSESLPSNSSIRDEELGTSKVRSFTRFTLSRSDLGAKLECKVKNDAIERDLISWVEFDIHVKPSSLKIEGPIVPVISGHTVWLTCTVEGANPAANVTWYNHTKEVEPQPQSYSEVMNDGTFKTVSQLEIVASLFDHQGTFYCKGTNPVLHKNGDAALLKSFDLEVLHPPVVEVQPAGGLVVKETNEAKIFCTFKANPSNVTDVTWYKDDVKVSVNENERFKLNDPGVPTLTIRNVSRFDRGFYFCSLRNSIGVGKAVNSVEINILYPPAVQASVFPATVNEGNDGSVSLKCDIVDGNPQNLLRVRWYKNDEMQNEVTEKEIVWQNLSRNFTANFTCDGENTAGWGERSEPKELVVNYLPGPAVVKESTTAVKGHPITLECEVEDLGRPPASVFRWEYLDEVLHDTTHNLTVESTGLDTRGKYMCSAVNFVGTGPKGEFYLSPKAPPAVINPLPDMYGAPSDATNISLSCRIECEPLCQIEWRRNRTSIVDSDFYLIKTMILPEDVSTGYFTSLVSTLQWNMSAWPEGSLDRNRDNANYTCLSSGNSAGSGVSTTTVFKVEFPPENISLSASQLEVVEGEIPEKINCSANSWPPSQYTWKFSNKIIANSSQLFLNDIISRSKAGSYLCVASNQHGSAKAKAFINVLYKPECNIYKDRNENKEATLVCNAQANPTSVNFTWIKNNETLEKFIVTERTTSILTLGDSVSEHYGKYYCIVNNRVGESIPCTLELTGVVGTAGWGLDFGDENVVITAAVVTAVTVIFIIVIIVIIILIKRRRTHTGPKGTLEERETPEGRVQPTEATPVPKPGFRNSFNTNGSPNLKNENTDSGSPNKVNSDGDPVYQNVTAVGRKESGSHVVEQECRPMYENMTFHQREPKGNIHHDVRNDTPSTSTISSETNLPRPRNFKHLNIKSLRPTNGKSTKPINPIINLPVILSRSFIKPLDKNQNQQTDVTFDPQGSSERSKTSFEDKHMASEKLSKNPSFSTNNEGLVYADLSLPHSGARPVFRKNAPTEYATLNFTEEGEYADQTFQPRHK
ncbi:hemicentin-1-like isoform X2 [Limulus polyphemus]|uniref:Hemicentin-1-like isoform X2 n=1 Tax=Limulus polyphemus TaxID=6850 RepID=A0ABM1TAU1_LIMPO|nr:hemicentin-1-like isoform X2 [Limulus polyphemus]